VVVAPDPDLLDDDELQWLAGLHPIFPRPVRLGEDPARACQERVGYENDQTV